MPIFISVQLKNYPFIYLMSKILVQWNVGIIYVILLKKIIKHNLKLNNDYAENFSETTGIEIQNQHQGW